MPATIADLKVGDEVQVSGIPTAITASQITVGQMPDFLPGPGGPGGPPGGPGGPGTPGSSATRTQATAIVTARVTATSPLILDLGEGVSLILTPAPNARIQKIAPVALKDLKLGDQITAGGRTGEDGAFTAAIIAVNMNVVRMGMGGFGGFGGPPPGFGGDRRLRAGRNGTDSTGNH